MSPHDLGQYQPKNAAEWGIFLLLAVYVGSLWFMEDVCFPALTWLWNVTPATWPIWGKALIYPAVFVPVSWLRWHWRDMLGLLLGLRLVFGHARFATVRELRRAGMLKPGGRFLGRMRSSFLFLHGEGHCLTIAAQGGGKTTGLIIPSLITYRAGSVVVTDPKGAITAQTKRLRAGFSRVVVLNPWGEELAADPAFGVNLGDDGFNPLQAVSVTPEGRAAASLLASLLLPDKPNEDSYFVGEGRELIEWAMLWMAAALPEERRTLPNLRDILFDAPKLLALFKAVAETQQAGPGWHTLRQGASKLHGMGLAGAGPQLMGIIGTATTALKIYAHETRLAAHVSRNGFRLADLKGDDKLTVYVVCPPDHLVSDDRRWLNLVLAMIAQQIGKPGKAVETVLLMDEFPALGYLPNLCGSLEQFREAGLRAHLITQNVGQILVNYGEDGLRRLWGCCETKQFFRIADPQTAVMLSEWLGQRTVVTTTTAADGTKSRSLVGVPLVRPEELTGLRSSVQIITRPAMNPIKASVFPYFKNPAWVAAVDENPYRKGT